MRSAIVRLAILAAAGVHLVLLSGCGALALPPPTAPATSSTPKPIFASDEEALAAAEEAYAAYLKASDELWQPGSSVSREDFLALSAGQAHDDDVAAGKYFADRGWRKVGHSSFDSVRLQSTAPGNDGSWVIRVYLCLDVSESDVVDSTGQSVAPRDRVSRTPLEVELTTLEDRQDLQVTESTVWSGSNFC